MSELPPITVIMSDAARTAALQAGKTALFPYPERLDAVVGNDLTVNSPTERVLAIGGKDGWNGVYTDPEDTYRVVIQGDQQLPLNETLATYELPGDQKLPACLAPMEWTGKGLTHNIYSGSHRPPSMLRLIGSLLLGGASLGGTTGYVWNKLAESPLGDGDAALLGGGLGLAVAGFGFLVTPPIIDLARWRKAKRAAAIPAIQPVEGITAAEPQAVYISETARRLAMTTDNARAMHVNHADIATLGKLLGNQEAAQRLFSNGLLIRSTAENKREEAGYGDSTKYFKLVDSNAPPEQRLLTWMDRNQQPKNDLEQFTGTTEIFVDTFTTQAITTALLKKGREYGKDLRKWPMFTAMNAALGLAINTMAEGTPDDAKSVLTYLAAVVGGAIVGRVVDVVRGISRRRKIVSELARIAPIPVEEHAA